MNISIEVFTHTEARYDVITKKIQVPQVTYCPCQVQKHIICPDAKQMLDVVQFIIHEGKELAINM
jgi:hypothetical protein